MPDYFQSYIKNLASARYELALSRLSPDAIHSATLHPVEFLYPFARLLVSEISTHVQALTHRLEHEFLFGAAAAADVGTLEMTWAVLHDLELDVVDSAQSLRRHVSFNQALTDPLLIDFDVLSEMIERAQKDLRDYLSRHVAARSLEESRAAVVESKKSIELADSVKKLTQLAFVFVPLNFVTSLFGMNFVEFGTGVLHIWVAAVVAIVLSASVMAILVWFRLTMKREK
jgi:hypothetical protein